MNVVNVPDNQQIHEGYLFVKTRQVVSYAAPSKADLKVASFSLSNGIESRRTCFTILVKAAKTQLL